MLFFSFLPVVGQIQDCEILNSSTEVTFNGHTVTETCSYILQINNAKGTNYAEITIPYSSGRELKSLEAQIETINGEIIRKLKKKDIEYVNAFSHTTFFSDNKIAKFKLIHNTYPYLIKYSFVYVQNQFIDLAHWYPVTNEKTPVKEAELLLKLPVGCNISIRQQGVDEPSRTTKEDVVTYSWVIKNQVAPKHETMAPPLREFLPFVRVVPKDFYYRLKGRADDWISYGNWLYEINAPLKNLPAEEKQKVHSLTDHLSSKREKTKVLYHYLQDNCRYINVSIEQGGMCPYPASYVSHNKYGDCKALTNYMQALLEEVGIPSVYTDVYAGDIPINIMQETPSQQFNHVFLCVPLDGDTVWLECTSSVMPFDHPSTFTQNRKVLLIEKDNSRLIQTPSLSLGDVEEQYKHLVHVDPDGKGFFQTSAILKGGAFELLAGMNSQLDDRHKADVMEELGIINGADITTNRINRSHRDTAWVQLELEGSINHLAEKVGNRLLVKPIHAFYWRLEKPLERTQPLVIPYPTYEQDTIDYIFPNTIQSISGIRAAQVESVYGKYSRAVMFQGKTLRVIRQLLINPGCYNLKEYADFFKFTKEVADIDNQKALITYN